MASVKVKENNYGLMELFIKVNGLMIWLMEKVSLDNMMEVNMKEISKMIDFMDMESLSLLIKILFIKENLISIYNMVMELRFLLLNIISTQEISKMILSKDMVILYMKMEVVMTDCGKMESLMAKGII
jgi:hypothetical protein